MLPPAICCECLSFGHPSLVVRAIGGGPAAVGCWYDICTTRLHGICISIVGSESVCETGGGSEQSFPHIMIQQYIYTTPYYIAPDIDITRRSIACVPKQVLHIHSAHHCCYTPCCLLVVLSLPQVIEDPTIHCSYHPYRHHTTKSVSESIDILDR
jgi:hypothetical protein